MQSAQAAVDLPPRPKTYNGDLSKLPPALSYLRAQPVWLCWRWFWNGNKWTKPPYCADNPERYAATNNPETWGTHEQAVKQVLDGKADGIGFALKDSNIGAVDLDHCRDPETGVIESWAEEYVKRFPGAYVEYTVSGEGLRIIGLSAVENRATKHKLPHGNGAAIEFFSRSTHYLTLSCNEISACRELPAIGEKLVEIVAELCGRPKQGKSDFKTNGNNGAAVPPPQWSPDEEARLRGVLSFIPTDEKVINAKLGHSHQIWVNIGRAIERLDWGERGYAIWRDWSAKSDQYNEAGLQMQWASFNRTRRAADANPVTIATVYGYAMKCGYRDGVPLHGPAADYVAAYNGADNARCFSLEDFHAFAPTHQYIFGPTREMWYAAAINAVLGAQPLLDSAGRPLFGPDGKAQTIAANVWLDRYRRVEQITWAPGEEEVIRGWSFTDGGRTQNSVVSCFNFYRPPTIIPGDAAKAGPWLDHLLRVFGEEHIGHLLNWFAHRVQRPADKINHALVVGGRQGIGKDTALEPVKRAIGHANFREAAPHNMLERFNAFLRSVILRISEARDLGDVNRYQFYERMKVILASPPDVLRVDEKHKPDYYIPNCVGVIITTNHKDSIFLPPDDRRHFVLWSSLTKESFGDEGARKLYWDALWDWLDSDGDRHVAAYLGARDISGFNSKAPPPQTQAFWDIVQAGQAPEEGELADALDALGRPAAVTLGDIKGVVGPGPFLQWLEDRASRRAFPHRMEAVGYVNVRNPDAENGLWRIGGVRQAIYGRAGLTPRELIEAVRRRQAGHADTHDTGF